MTSTGYVALFVSNADGEQYAYPVLLHGGELVVAGPAGELVPPAANPTEKTLDAVFAGVVPAVWTPSAAPAPAGREKARKAKDAAEKVRGDRNPPVIARGRNGPEPAPEPIVTPPPPHREPAPGRAR